MASVAFERVGKTYPNGYRALAEFNLAIGDGELVVFVGPSGCGKSTLLRLVAGLEQPSSGHVRIGRDIVDEWTPQARNVAMVFQDYALYPNMTVRGNLSFPLQMRKLPQAEIRRRIAWATDLLALSDVLDRLPKQLSGGQRQRVAMGRALVREPTVFLLDEPLSNLDAQLRTQVRGEIVDLQRRTGTTMIYVTHDQVEAMTMGQRIAVLSGGHLQQSGSPQALYDTPANTFVAGFIGTPPMNLIPRTLLLRAAERAAAAGGQSRTPWLDMLSGDPDWHTAGIRPEHVAINRDLQAPGLPVTIVQTEYLGHETLVHFCFSGLEHRDTRAIFIARVDGSPRFENAQPASVSIDGNQLSRFDGNGNRRLG